MRARTIGIAAGVAAGLAIVYALARRSVSGEVASLTALETYRLTARSVDAQHSTTLVTLLDQASIDLVPQALYRARVTMTSAQNLIPTSAIKSKLTEMGFAFVSIFSKASELPPDWPSTEKADESSGFGGTAWIEATYTGKPQTIARPPVAAHIWASGLVGTNAQIVADELAILGWEALSTTPNQADPFVWTVIARYHGKTGDAPKDGSRVNLIHVVAP